MTWQSEREEWNREGKCARQDCKQTAKVYRGPKVCDMCGGPFGIHRNLNTMNGEYYCCTCVKYRCFYVDSTLHCDKFVGGVWTLAHYLRRKMRVYGGNKSRWFRLPQATVKGSNAQRANQKLARQSARGSARQQEKRRWREEVADMEYSKESP